MKVLYIFIWLTCSVLSYLLIRRWFLNCEMQPHWGPGEFWTTANKAMGVVMSLILGPMAVICCLFTFCRLDYKK